MCVIEGLMARKEPKSPKVSRSGSGAGDLLEHQCQCGLCGDDGPKALKSRYGACKRVGPAKAAPLDSSQTQHRTKRLLSGALHSATGTPSPLTSWMYTLVTTRATLFPATPFIDSSTQF